LFCNFNKKERKKKPSNKESVIAREATVNIHKRIHGVQFKKRAPRAVKSIREFAHKITHTKDIRIAASLNKFLWSKGVRNVPRRVRVLIERKRNDDEEAQEKMYTLVSHVPVPSFKGLQTKKAD
jgi:large subunit ribosomal protein L31e